MRSAVPNARPARAHSALPARVLLVSDSYPPLVGGATHATEQLAHELVAEGVGVTVATAWQRKVAAESNDGGARVYRLRSLISRIGRLSSDPNRYTPPPFPDPELAWRLRRLVKQVRPDVIHSYGWITYSLLAATRGDAAPLIVSHRDYAMVCPKRTLMRGGLPCDGPGWRKCVPCAADGYGWVRGLVATLGVLSARRRVGRATTVVHSCSDFVRRTVDRILPRPDSAPHLVIPDFRDEVDRTEVGDADLSMLPDRPYILFVGGLRMVKGLDVLLAAHQRLSDPPPLVLLGGTAPDTPPIPSEVVAPGNLSNAAVLAAWDNALFGVAPSRLPEPLGNVVHEAMSRGRPVIGSTVGGHGDMITPGIDGLLVPPGDIAALTSTMQHLVDDPELRSRLGAEAKSSAERFTRSTVLPQFLDLYRTAAAPTASPPDPLARSST